MLSGRGPDGRKKKSGGVGYFPPPEVAETGGGTTLLCHPKRDVSEHESIMLGKQAYKERSWANKMSFSRVREATGDRAGVGLSGAPVK